LEGLHIQSNEIGIGAIFMKKDLVIWPEL